MPDEPKKLDVVVVGGPTEDGKGANVLRMRPGRVETGQVRPLEEGKPIAGEIVKLTPREDAPVCDVEVLHAPTPSPAPIGKPAQVATERYRENWEAIFGAPPSSSSSSKPN